ncbi:MAG: xanthine dehydrogenase family protein [Deltaproteobacteria bacterium]|nr:xanthine dehydrogenase family protein [Deltaproteobacteria bacterium]
MGYVGARIKRVEDLRFLRGIGKFVGDIRRVGMTHAAILRSPYAHARVVKIDTASAAKTSGVIGILTATDMPDLQTIPMRIGSVPGLERSLQYPIATDRVRYVGDPVAVVVAVDRYVADDALELIEVEYESLPPVVDTRAAMRLDGPRLHDAVPSNVAAKFKVDVGNIDRAMAEADLVIEEEFFTQRHGAVPLETRGLVAEFDEGREILTMWGPTKMTHVNRGILSNLLDLPESSIHFIEPDVGGGFGARGEFYPEDFLVPFAAIYFRRPVCWIEDRSENLKATNQSREQQHRIKVAVKQDGTILGLEDQILFDMGAYTRTHGGIPGIAASAMLRGPYGIKNYRCTVFCVLTNKTPAGTYRSPGRYEANFVRERAIDLIAHRLKLDPAEVRRRNFIPPQAMPYDQGSHPFHYMVYDSGDYPGLFEKALARVNYPGIKRECESARQQGRALGVGLGYFVETSGLGPWEYARVEIDTKGRVILYSGCASVGQGVDTVLSQIVADELSVRLENVRVVRGDTARVPYGLGSNASRTTVMAGNAALGAAQKVKRKVLDRAAAHLEIGLDDLFIEDGRVIVRGSLQRSISFAEVARLSDPGIALKSGFSPGLSEENFFASDRRPFPYGVHVAVVEVDRETGMARLLKYLVAEDVGRAVNPMLIEGQMAGGLAQGIGGALLEEFVYDFDGTPLATTFMDYLLPTAMEIPPADFLPLELVPSPLNPLGVKGAGEGGIAAAGGAIANAVCDALGVEVKRLPLKPEYLLNLLQKGREFQSKTPECIVV